jgi:hypothetical protein
VEPEHPVGAAGLASEGADRQPGGVARQQRGRGQGRVETAEDLPLEVEDLGHGLDGEVARGQPGEVVRRRDPADDGLCLGGAHPAARHPAGADLGHVGRAALEGRRVGVDQDDLDAARRRGLGDLAAHHPAPITAALAITARPCAMAAWRAGGPAPRRAAARPAAA